MSSSAPGSDALLDGVELVVKSPGVPADAPPVSAARARGIPVISEIELGARLLENPIIGITGTNGKTTTTALLGAMFDAAGMPAEVAGNIGRPLTSLVGRRRRRRGSCASSPRSSSRTSRRSTAGSRCSSTSSRITSTGTASFEAYRDAKLRIFERRPPTTSRSFRAASAPCRARRAGVEFDGDDELPAEPLIPGAHNRENAAAATAAARAAGIPDDAIAEALRTFPGVEHRIEEVATVAGVRYVNDSKATNVAAALRALASFPGARKLVILGGRGKAEPYAPLAEAFAAGDRAYLIGEATEAIAAALEAAGVPFERSRRPRLGGRRGRAPTRGRETSCCSRPRARATTSSRDYEERGQEFGKLVQKLRGEQGTA